MNFKLRLEDIPEKGYYVKKDVDFSFLRTILTNQWIDRGNSVTIELMARKRQNMVIEEGKIYTDIGFICSRCADDCLYSLNLRFLAVFTEEGKENCIDGLNFDEHVFPEFYPIVEGEVDLRHPIDETIVLNLPLYPKCREDCKGICPNCGRNLNSEQCMCQSKSIQHPFEKLKTLKKGK